VISKRGVRCRLYDELLKRWLYPVRQPPILDALAEHELTMLTNALAGDPNAMNVNAADQDVVQAALTQKQLEDPRADLQA
jgi:hypothetical protein